MYTNVHLVSLVFEDPNSKPVILCLICQTLLGGTYLTVFFLAAFAGLSLELGVRSTCSKLLLGSYGGVTRVVIIRCAEPYLAQGERLCGGVLLILVLRVCGLLSG